MPRRKKPTVEIVPASSALARQTEGGLAVPPNAAKLEAFLDRLIQQRVSEALSRRDDALFEPYFRPKRVADEIRRHQSVSEQRKWAMYFEKWGCIVCRRKKAMHAGNGYCSKCRIRIVSRLKTIEREQTKQYAAAGGEAQVEQITSRVRDAERLLGEMERPRRPRGR